MHREERKPTLNLQQIILNLPIWTPQNFAVFAVYNDASVAAGNATTKKPTLRGYFPHYYVFVFYVTAQRSGAIPKDPGQ